jgi:hypothetical protein
MSASGEVCCPPAVRVPCPRRVCAVSKRCWIEIYVTPLRTVVSIRLVHWLFHLVDLVPYEVNQRRARPMRAVAVALLIAAFPCAFVAYHHTRLQPLRDHPHRALQCSRLVSVESAARRRDRPSVTTEGRERLA